jgi:uncharacterized membrane protein
MSRPSFEQKREFEALVEQVDPKVFQGLRVDQKNRLLKALPQVTSVMLAQYHSGPLPPTEMLAEYDNLIPNGAERIMAMAEKQSLHRQTLEATVISSQNRQGERGQIFAFILAVLLIVAGVLAVLQGAEKVACVIFGATIVGLCALFIAGKKAQSKDLAKK